MAEVPDATWLSEHRHAGGTRIGIARNDVRQRELQGRSVQDFRLHAA